MNKNENNWFYRNRTFLFGFTAVLIVLYIAISMLVPHQEFGTREQVIYHPENDYTKKLLTVVPKLQGETDGE